MWFPNLEIANKWLRTTLARNDKLLSSFLSTPYGATFTFTICIKLSLKTIMCTLVA